MSRIGIFSGTFDPIHKGHIAFGLQAIEEANLSKVYFMPESKPRRKEGVTHYAHRVAMLKLALKPFKKLDILEVSDSQFSVVKTMPKLLQQFKDAELYLLIGSDAVQYIKNFNDWPNAEKMLENFNLIIALRSADQEDTVRQQLKSIDRISHKSIIIDSPNRHASSGDIRAAISRRGTHTSQLHSTKKYISKNWLYESVKDSGTKS